MKTLMRSVLISLALFLYQVPLFSQSTSRFSHEKYAGPNGDTLHYRLLSPDYDTVRRYPLVLFLHGSGESGTDNEAQLNWGVMNFATDQAMVLYPAIIVAPQCPVNQEWGAYTENEKAGEVRLLPHPSESMALVMGLLKKLTRTLPVDTDRIYITGLSMGGYGTFDAIERYPGYFAAAVPVCGGGDVTRAASIGKTPVWIFQGSEDAGVNSDYSLDMTIALKKAGAHPGLTYYPGVGHFAWLAAYSDPLLMAWLFRQHR